MIKRFIIAFILVVLVVGGHRRLQHVPRPGHRAIFRQHAASGGHGVDGRGRAVEWTPGIDAIGTVSAARGVDLTVETAGIVKEIGFSANQQVEARRRSACSLTMPCSAPISRPRRRRQRSTSRCSTARARTAKKRRRLRSDGRRRQSGRGRFQARRWPSCRRCWTRSSLRRLSAARSAFRRSKLGQYLAPGTVVATLQDLETMRADFSVPEQQLALLKIGQPVRFGVSENDLPFTGSITGIEPQGQPGDAAGCGPSGYCQPRRPAEPGPVCPGPRRTAGGRRHPGLAADGAGDQPLWRLRLCASGPAENKAGRGRCQARRELGLR